MVTLLAVNLKLAMLQTDRNAKNALSQQILLEHVRISY